MNSAGISLRKGDSKFTWLSPAATDSSSLNMGIFPYGDGGITGSKLIVPVASSFANAIWFYDLETQALLYTTASANAGSFTSLYFNKYLYFFPDTSTLAPGYYWNGTAFGVCGYTGTGNFYPIGGNVYNHRAYLAQLNEAAYWYSGIDQISGACTKIDLSGIVEQNCTLSSIASFTLSDQTTTQEYQAFIMSNGEVLFYSGTYPDSANWSTIGRAKVGQPLYKGSTVKYQGDTLLLCDSGIISLRSLFLSGAQNAESLSTNSKIQQTWRTLVKVLRSKISTPVGPITPGKNNGTIRGVFDSSTDRIVVSFPYQLTSATAATAGSTFFCCYTPLQSWFIQRSTGDRIDDICIYNNSIKMLAQSINAGTGDLELMAYSKEGSTGYMDRDSADVANVAYDFEMISAPIPFPKTQVVEVSGIEPIIKSDLYAETNYNLVSDFGRQTSGTQPVADQGASIAKPMVNIGAEANFVQLKISGTTAASKTVGLDLYSYNVWFSSGDKGSR